jgi:hypothetical protein
MTKALFNAYRIGRTTQGCVSDSMEIDSIACNAMVGTSDIAVGPPIE